MALKKCRMSFPRRRESRKYLSELYSKFLYNFVYFKCFFWILAFSHNCPKLHKEVERNIDFYCI
ncbi:hypothetical protein [Rickettsia endosymbiont of Orchestes rusci]|uniref:hypothetical protein n=1 Tax=Rickettsia endosymbiont of Orchestes rusci TaxID=3066250 RepID=UPI00313D7429